MSKIKQARAWLTRKERTNSSPSEKKGDITLQNIIWIAVAVILIGLVVGILIVVINSQGDEIAENASGITNQDAAIYDANCNGRDVGRIGFVDDYDTAGNDTATLLYDPNTGYQHPTADFSAALATAGAGEFVVDGAVNTATEDHNVGFLHTVSNVSEARFNADFDNNGVIDEGQVVAVIAAPGVVLDAADTNIATAAGAPEIRVARTTNLVENIRVGSRLVVDSRNGCWGVRI